MSDPGASPGVSRSRPLALDDHNPWPGLDAYDEASAHYFHGRKREATELLRLVRLAPLTALYGKSGLGKSSLLRAGLFPLLRERHYLPIYLHIDFSDDAAQPPLEQIAHRFHEELVGARADFPERAPGEGLWEYLHRNDMEIWSGDNFPLTPLLVFDQFEELFVRGPGHGKWVQQVRDSLGDLIENRIPAELADEGAKPRRSQLNLLSQRYRIILSFREDYLPELKAWENDIPSLLRNYLRLEPMTRACAIEAVEGPGNAVLEPGVASSIVDFVGNIGTAGKVSGEAVIEPVLLCLCCYQLNRRRRPGGKIDKALVESAGEDILDDYYEAALADPEVRSGPDVAKFIETYLIQGDRFRGNYPRQEAIDAKLLNETQLDALTDRHRLLRVVQYQDTARIELIHDRLVEVACKFRDERQAAHRARRLKQRAGAIIAVFAIVLAIVAYLYVDLWIKTRPWATLESAVTGRSYALSKDVANIGRPTEGFPLPYEVELRPRSISRLHLMIFRNASAIDLRSLYGTTVNGEFLHYGDQVTLEDKNVIVLAGTAAFVFHPLKYEPWHLLWPPPRSNKPPPAGWGLLIDSNRRLVLPLTRDQEFIVPQGERGVEPRARAEGAIAVVRRVEVRGQPMVSADSQIAELFRHRPEDSPRAEVALLALAPAQPSVGAATRDFLTIEKLADGNVLQADMKLDDYSYGRLTIPPGKQYFYLRSSRGVRDHTVTELAFHQGQRRFQVIWRAPEIERAPAAARPED